MLSIVQMVDDLEVLVLGVKADAIKLQEKGNSAAGTRIRVTMQDVKKKAQEIRSAVADARKK